MPKYCCFIHPDFSEEDRELGNVCPQCRKAYGFPLWDVPAQIEQYKIIKPLDRGFYSAAFVAETGTFSRRRVIKIVSKNVYDYFKKDFTKECQDHASVAEGSHHIANIHDMKKDVAVNFNGTTVLCHVAEMDYVDGVMLNEYLRPDRAIQANTIAQIAMDLFALLSELQNKNLHHNDLHAGNLIVQQLDDKTKRAEAEDQFVRLIAIDLNSMSDKSKSDPAKQRYGDLHWVVQHLRMLVDRLLLDPDSTDDMDYRLAGILQERAELLAPEATSQRTPTYDECIEDIRTAMQQQKSPWREIPRLRRFNDAYNAQTLEPWFVPYLLVDPDERWLSAISTPGPQIITGMRGCGKTMLLRALQFHARATSPDNSDPDKLIARLTKDGYIGLYASSTRLLENSGSSGKIREPFARLYIAYSIQALRALRHLREIKENLVYSSFYRNISKAVAEHIKGAEYVANASSEFHLERLLLNISVRLSRLESEYSLPANPSLAFPDLAEAIRRCSQIWSNSAVLFLLDDVSTRYMQEDSISQLTSALIFSHPTCAFKITTEAQTLEMILYSPGKIERARRGRDYDVFDLGAAVYELTKSRSGSTFVEDILKQRSRYFKSKHPQFIQPRDFLGDTSLASIAVKIGATSSTSRERKKTYRGITALTRVCVGDIGDVIIIYEDILHKAKPKSYPVDSQTQSQCFQDFCSRRLYDLNRRNGWLKDHAQSFAEASYDLLMQSYKAKKANGKKIRLRQYLKIYVRVTAGDADAQFGKLRELIDAGVFILDGGSYRAKTRDSDPIQQFKLTFRKLYGLSNFIGLSERDRFELSGSELEVWLNQPLKGKEILKRNSAIDDEAEEISEDDVEEGALGIESETEEETEQETPIQQLLWNSIEDSARLVATEGKHRDEVKIDSLIRSKIPHCKHMDGSELVDLDIDTMILGLGFEERTFASVKETVSRIRPKKAICIQYKEKGYSSEIIELLEARGTKPVIYGYGDISTASFNELGRSVLVDITGLAKPIIFHSIRKALKKQREVIISHTQALKHYPLDTDIEAVLRAEEARDYYALLDRLRRILTGERGPYSFRPLLETDSDDSRRRVLFTFASPKHERLLSLLDNRAFDFIQVITQDESTPRGKLAKISADFAAKNYPNTDIVELKSNDLPGVLKYISERYHDWYIDRGFNFEFGLTGSKLQAVACAAAAAVLKVSQCWYVQPKEFDKERFTSGVGPTSFYKISLG